MDAFAMTDLSRHSEAKADARETVARALCRYAWQREFHGKNLDAYVEIHWRDHLPAACVALDAIQHEQSEGRKAMTDLLWKINRALFYTNPRLANACVKAANEIESAAIETRDTKPVARCQITGNPVGTDTRPLGQPCNCATCANTQTRIVECPSCRNWRDECSLCGGTGEVTEQQSLDFGAEP